MTRSALLIVIVYCMTYTTLADPKSAFETLFALDCKGTVHLMPHSMWSTQLQSPIANVIKTAVERVQSRISCWCGSETIDFDKYYDPATAALFAAQPGKQDSPACTTGDNYVRDLVKGLQQEMGDMFQINLPSSCTYDTYTSSGCLMKAAIAPLDVTVQLAIKKCPEDYGSRHPYISVNCEGTGCRVAHPCKEDADCGSTKMKCYTPKTSSTIASLTSQFLQIMKESYYYGPDATEQSADPSPNTILTGMMNWAVEEGYFPGSPDDLEQIGACMWSELVDNKINWEDVGKDIATATWDEKCSDRIDNMNIKFADPTKNVWDGTLESGDDVFSDDRLSGEEWGGTSPPIDSEGITVFSLNCASQFTFLASEKYGIRATMKSMMPTYNKLYSYMTQIWENRGLENFIENQAAWNPQAWLNGGMKDGDISKYTAGSLMKELFTSWRTAPDAYPNLWTKQYGGASSFSKMVTQALTDHFNANASPTEKASVALGLTEAYPTIGKLVHKYNDAKDYLATMLSTITPTQASNVDFDPYDGARLKNIPPAEDEDEPSCSLEKWKDDNKCYVRVTGLKPLLGDTIIDAGGELCDDYPDGVPAAIVHCKSGLCDEVKNKGGLCGVDSDCAAYGTGFTCQQLIPEKSATENDFISMFLWADMNNCKTAKAGDCECNAWNTGIGSENWQKCKDGLTACPDKISKCFSDSTIQDDLAAAWDNIIGVKPTGNVKTCLPTDVPDPDDNGENKVYDFYFTTVDGEFGAPGTALYTPSFNESWNNQTLNSMAGNFTKWLRANPVDGLPEDYFTRSGAKNTTSELGRAYGYTLLQKLRSVDSTIKSGAISVDVQATWDDGRKEQIPPYKLYTYVYTSIGSAAQQTALMNDFDKLALNYMTKTLNMTNAKSVPNNSTNSYDSCKNQPNQMACEMSGSTCVWKDSKCADGTVTKAYSGDFYLAEGAYRYNSPSCSDVWTGSGFSWSWYDERLSGNVQWRYWDKGCTAVRKSDGQPAKELYPGNTYTMTFKNFKVTDGRFNDNTAASIKKTASDLFQAWNLNPLEWASYALQNPVMELHGIVSVPEGDMPQPNLNSAAQLHFLSVAVLSVLLSFCLM